VIILIVLGVPFVPLAYRAIQVVPEYNRLVVFRLGRCIGQKGPGLVWLWPVLDRAVAGGIGHGRRWTMISAGAPGGTLPNSHDAVVPTTSG